MEDLGSFFRRYADAHLKFEADALDAFYNFPCLINDLMGVHAIGSVEDLHKYNQSFFAPARTAFRPTRRIARYRVLPVRQFGKQSDL